MKVKSLEELKNILASELRAYSYEVGTGRGLDLYMPLLEGKPATVIFTLDETGGLVASDSLPPPPEEPIAVSTPFFDDEQLASEPEKVEEAPKSTPRRRKSS